MKALCWHGKGDVRVNNVPDPEIINPRDAIIKVTSTAICGSDLHLYNGIMPGMKEGDIIGHEFMGEVVEVGSKNKKLKKGDRVVVPFTISCGSCYYCQKGIYSLCDNSNPNEEIAQKVMGHSPAGLFGYTHMLGGYAGGQAEYVRVPFADVGPIKVSSDLEDEQVLFLSDVFPTGYMAAENAEIEPGDTVAVWGAGVVGQFAVKSAWMMEAGRVIAIDRLPSRLRKVEEQSGAETINFEEEDVYETLMEMTAGHGPDRCIDAVGTEAHAGGSMDAILDRAKQMAYLATDRPHVLRETIRCCRKGGTISLPGVYVGYADKIPVGAMMNKNLTLKGGQTHVQRYLEPLLKKIEQEEIDPGFVVTHRLKLDEAPDAYETFRTKEDECLKVVLTP
ncbi:MAG: zinc-dependent alcohol dehydrogenase [Balneolaceae bacterium]